MSSRQSSRSQSAIAGRQRPRRLSGIRQILAACITTRLAVDTSAQLFNSFLQVIAVGMALDIVVLGRLVSLRSAMGLSSPLFGSAADRYGYRRVLRLALLISAAGMFLLGSGAGFWSVVAGMVVLGLGLGGFVPTLQAYISAQLPFEKRARGIGVLEYSWALAGIVGLSLMGFLFDRVGWQAPFFVLGTAMLGGWVLFSLLPGTPPDAARSARSGDPQPTSDAQPIRRRIIEFFDLGPNWRSAYAVICGSVLFFFGQFHIIISHGAWLQSEYGLSAAGLGIVALLQGVADLCGSVLVSLITDRVGKKRAVQAGMIGSFLVYSSLPFVNVGLLPAVAALVLMRFTFEYGIVSNISLVSEQAPDRRGKVMALASAIGLLGATMTGFTGPWMYSNFGVWGLGPVSAASTLLALTVLTFFGREPTSFDPISAPH